MPFWEIKIILHSHSFYSSLALQMRSYWENLSNKNMILTFSFWTSTHCVCGHSTPCQIPITQWVDSIMCVMTAGVFDRDVYSIHLKEVAMFRIALPCKQALLGVGGGRGKEEIACNDVSGIFISALKKSTQNADWWRFNLVLTSLLLACVLLTTQKWWRSFYLWGLREFPLPPPPPRELARRLCLARWNAHTCRDVKVQQELTKPS